MKRQKYHHYNNLHDENQSSIKLKKAKVARYLIDYKKAKNKLIYYDAISNDENNLEMEKLKLEKYIEYIDNVLEMLCKDSKVFIINEYIKNFNNKTWWKSSLNRSTYFKIRRSALDEFLMYVE